MKRWLEKPSREKGINILLQPSADCGGTTTEARSFLSWMDILLKGTCVLIPPGVVHRAVGKMTVLIVVFPKFDPNDEVLSQLTKGTHGEADASAAFFAED